MSERGKPGRKATWPRRVSVLDRSGSDVGSRGTGLDSRYCVMPGA